MSTLRTAAASAVNCCARPTTFRSASSRILLRPQRIRVASHRRTFNLTTARNAATNEGKLPEEDASIAEDEEPEILNSFLGHKWEFQQPGANIQAAADIFLHKDEVTHRGTKDSGTFKRLMRTVVKPVTIISARRQDVEDDRKGTVAATISSFNSVAIEPEVLISFNLKQNSATFEVLRVSKHFCVTFPRNDKAGVGLASRLTQGNQTSHFVGHPNERLHLVPMAAQTAAGAALKHFPSAVSLSDPAEYEKSGLAFAFACEYLDSYPVGDHYIVTAKVLLSSKYSGLPHGWSNETKHDSPFEGTYLTLSHVYGKFAAPETGFGLDSMWKMGDPFRFADARRLPERAIACYKRRLWLYEEALAIREGHEIIKTENHSRAVLKSQDLPVSRLRALQRYYMLRLSHYTSTEHEAAQAKKLGSTAKSIGGHQRLFVQRKVLSSDASLEDEETLYRRRLEGLRNQNVSDNPETGHPSAPDEQSQIEGIDEVDESASSPFSVNVADLTVYFEERLRLIQEARRIKAGQKAAQVTARAATSAASQQVSSAVPQGTNPGLNFETACKRFPILYEKEKNFSFFRLLAAYTTRSSFIREHTTALLVEQSRPILDHGLIATLQEALEDEQGKRDLMGHLLSQRVAKGLAEDQEEIEDLRERAKARLRRRPAETTIKTRRPNRAGQPDKVDGTRSKDDLPSIATIGDLYSMPRADVGTQQLSNSNDELETMHLENVRRRIASQGIREEELSPIQHYEGEEIPTPKPDEFVDFRKQNRGSQ